MAKKQLGANFPVHVYVSYPEGNVLFAPICTTLTNGMIETFMFLPKISSCSHQTSL